ncbi:uncharacterized protein LOC129602747 isoform X2 [Paramacrobiotus metropolitanus]|nr:uncharacterized protein LOC129602747 isoform X2 [Paramacrobiotus metropolitanus]
MPKESSTHNVDISSGRSEPCSTSASNSEKVGGEEKQAKVPAFGKECILSPELAAFLGKERMSRSEVVSAMWKTIRERGLIDPNQKQYAVCDEQLFKVIGRKRFKVFGMMKFLKGHIQDPNKKK